MKPWVKRGLAGGLAVAVIVGTYVFVLPQFANYSEVWAQVKTLSWEWILVLIGAVIFNLATFAPPWMAALPGLGYWSAETVTQASTASTYLAPGGPAVGIGISAAMLFAWGFHADEVALAVTLTGIWNQLAILGFPTLALALLTLTGGDRTSLQTIAMIGLAVFVVVAGGFALALSSRRNGPPRRRPRREDRQLGAAAASGAARSAGTARASRTSASQAIGLLRRRWHLLTLATLVGQLSVFLVLLACLRALGVGRGRGERDRGVRRLVAGAGARLDPDHAGRPGARRARPDDGARGLRRQPRGRRCRRARLPLPDDRADARARRGRGRDLAPPAPLAGRRAGLEPALADQVARAPDDQGDGDDHQDDEPDRARVAEQPRLPGRQPLLRPLRRGHHGDDRQPRP